MIQGQRNPLHFGLPDRLKRARQGAGITRAKLSLLAGLSDDAALYIERGTRVPGIDTAEQLARALAISPCFLAYGIEAGCAPSDALLCEGCGVRLKQTRERIGLSLRALARAADLVATTISNIEQGQVMPSVATAEQLAGALGVSPCWLAYGQGPEVLPRPPRRKPVRRSAPERRVRRPGARPGKPGARPR